MSADKKISIIIRTRNEERWITQCLAGVFGQKRKGFDYDVIIVDNKSIDKTLMKAKHSGVTKILTCSDYLPGKALNMGIRKTEGDYIVCLSGHCIPVNDMWISNLLRNFGDKKVAGVYGRQEPISSSPDSDKRDLALVFGMDRKVQIKDSFFHNANSMIRRDIWEKIPFDDNVTNIEDRVWAQKALQNGYKIVYDPDASVYHYHGIHQDGDLARCANVVKILERLHKNYKYKTVDIDKLNIIAMIPVRGQMKYLNGRPLIDFTIKRALESKYIKKVIVSTDTPAMANLARSLGAETPFLRDSALSKDYVDLNHVLRYSLEKIEEKKIFPDLIVSLEVTFPFRPKGFLDEMIARLVETGLDTVIAAKRENKALWKQREEGIIQLDEGFTPRQFKDPTFIELRGVGTVTHPEFLRQGTLLGQKIGFYEVNNPYSPLEVRNEEDLRMASLLTEEWFETK